MTTADLIVVGAGHAGCEAAAAAARMGASVTLLTLHRSTVAQMPCNPAIGGIGKGHLVAEIDALGGLQGWAADRSGLQFRVLNRSRGPAVWGPRAQCDKTRYGTAMRRVVERMRGVSLVEAEVHGMVVGDGGVAGVRLRGGQVLAGRAVLLTTGTFLGGVLHTGDDRRPGGRLGERPSSGLGVALQELGLELRRFKTGTPPRLARSSLDLGVLTEQLGDDEPRPFSWRTRAVRNRASCWITRTPVAVRQIILDNLERSPLFSGAIDGVGPRYCPSIEDKVVRFPHHESHTLFLEPEALEGERIYVNGLSTSLPADVQETIVRAVPGLEDARFLQYGYAVEYDVVAPRQVRPTMAVAGVPGLWVAGQLIGTSGYEEAAALGLVAGINAVRQQRSEAPFVPTREQAYMGVLVDDMSGRDHREPYRMLTSRAEHRLVLGAESARERLMPFGRELGLVADRVFHVEQARWARRRQARQELESARLNPDQDTVRAVRELAGVELAAPTTWAGLLRRHDVDAGRLLRELPELAPLDMQDRRIVLGLLRYHGYRQRSEHERRRVERLRAVPFPEGFAPEGVPGLSREVVEALTEDRPRTLAEAERLAAMTPAALAILAGYLRRR
jgi:tRNA uridine 5-carboxymethylaminomethyl modification enzyme